MKLSPLLAKMLSGLEFGDYTVYPRDGGDWKVVNSRNNDEVVGCYGTLELALETVEYELKKDGH